MGIFSKFNKDDRVRFTSGHDFCIYTVESFDGDMIELVEVDGLYHHSKMVKVKTSLRKDMWGMFKDILGR